MSSLKAWWQGGGGGSESTTTRDQRTDEEKLHSMRASRSTLERRVDAARARVATALERARAYGTLGQKEQARAELRKKADAERELTQAAGLLRTLDQHISTIETTALSASVASSMRDGAAVMASVHSDLKVDDIEQSMVDMRIKTREAEQVTRLMTRPLHSLDDDADADDDAEDERDALDRELDELLGSSLAADGADTDTSSAASTLLAETSAPTATVDSLEPVRAKTTTELERELGL